VGEGRRGRRDGGATKAGRRGRGCGSLGLGLLQEAVIAAGTRFGGTDGAEEGGSCYQSCYLEWAEKVEKLTVDLATAVL